MAGRGLVQKGPGGASPGAVCAPLCPGAAARRGGGHPPCCRKLKKQNSRYARPTPSGTTCRLLRFMSAGILTFLVCWYVGHTISKIRITQCSAFVNKKNPPLAGRTEKTADVFAPPLERTHRRFSYMPNTGIIWTILVRPTYLYRYFHHNIRLDVCQ